MERQVVRIVRIVGLHTVWFVERGADDSNQIVTGKQPVHILKAVRLGVGVLQNRFANSPGFQII